MTDVARLTISIPSSIKSAASLTTPRSATVVKMFHIERRLNALRDFQGGDLSPSSGFYRQFQLLGAEEVAAELAALVTQVQQLRTLLTKDDLVFVFRKGRRFQKQEVD